ncbi:MAG: cache domain-containing sensor histidine kinase [Bacillota bacterium]
MRIRLVNIINILKDIYTFLKNTFRISSIQSIITLSFTLITILAMVMVGIVFSGMFSESIESNAIYSSKQIMEQVSLNLEQYLKGMMEISDAITKKLYTDIRYIRPDLINLLGFTMETRKDIMTLAIFDSSGGILVRNPSDDYTADVILAEQEWFQKAIENKDKYVFLPPHVQRLFVDKHPWVVSLCRGTEYLYEDKKLDCVIMVDLNFNTIDALCKRVSLGKRGYVYIIDSSGNIIYHPQQQVLYAGLKEERIHLESDLKDGSFINVYNNEKRIISIKSIRYADWKLIGISYLDELAANQIKMQRFVVFIFIFAIIFMISASFFISSKISQPIKLLERQMKRVEKGEFDISIDVRGEDEVKHLSRTFNLMVTRIRELMNQIIKEQEAKRKSELKALQAQINPHFLYNTLDSIVWMNENRKYDEVSKMVAALAKLFRISISKGKEIITIQDELEHARSYLTIQKIRYKDKFDFKIEAQPEVLRQKTLKLILQPIIENSIYHGIEKIHDKGIIEVRAGISEDKTLIQVIDNGYGIPPAVLKDILKKESKNDASSGVGLKNVHERIQLYFGQDYGLEILSELDEGTTVNIRLPLNNSYNGNGG